MFSRIVSPKRIGSCGTTAICSRSDRAHIEEERDELACRELARGHLVAAVPEDDDRRREAQEPDRREHDRADARTVDALLEHHEELLVEAFRFVVLACERLDHTYLGKGLLPHSDG